MLLPPGWQRLNGRPLEDIAAYQWESTNRTLLEDLATLPAEHSTAVRYADFVIDPARIVQAVRFPGISARSGVWPSASPAVCHIRATP